MALNISLKYAATEASTRAAYRPLFESRISSGVTATLRAFATPAVTTAVLGALATPSCTGFTVALKMGGEDIFPVGKEGEFPVGRLAAELDWTCVRGDRVVVHISFFADKVRDAIEYFTLHSLIALGSTSSANFLVLCWYKQRAFLSERWRRLS